MKSDNVLIKITPHGREFWIGLCFGLFTHAAGLDFCVGENEDEMGYVTLNRNQAKALRDFLIEVLGDA